MSTIITLRIQDALQHSYGRPYQTPEARMIFHNEPGPDIPSHSPFDLVLTWRPYVHGPDPWRTDGKDLLPVNEGVWEVIDLDASMNPGCLSVRDTVSEFLIINPFS